MTNLVAQSQDQSQVPMTFQAKRTLASESHPAIALEKSPIDVKALGRRSREASDPGPSTQQLLQAMLPASLSSVSPLKLSGIPAASKEMVRVQSRDAGSMSTQNWISGSVVLPSGRHHGVPHSRQPSSQQKEATFLVHAGQSPIVRSKSEDTLAPKCLSLDLRPSAFNGSGARRHSRPTGSDAVQQVKSVLKH